MKTTKKLIMMILSVLIISCTRNSNNLVGEWNGTVKGENISLIIDKSKNATFLSGNKVIGGSNENGISMKYEIDDSKKPIWLDLVLYKKGNKKETARIKGITRFLTETKMEYRVTFDPAEDRFKEFNSEDEESTMILSRVKD